MYFILGSLTVSYLVILAQSSSPLHILNWLPFRDILKPLFRIVFYTLPLYIFELPQNFIISPYVIPFIASLYFIRRNEIRIYFDRNMVLLFEKETSRDLARAFVIYILGAGAQEIYYRGIVCFTLFGIVGWWAAVISAIMFVGEHFLHGANFQKTDYVLQFSLSILSCIMLYMTKSIMSSLILHIAYNLPAFLFSYRRYRL